MKNSMLNQCVILVFLMSGWATAQEFDEKFEYWPVDLKINGTIVLHNQADFTRLKPESIDRISPATSRRVRQGQDKQPNVENKPVATIVSWIPMTENDQNKFLDRFQLKSSSAFVSLQGQNGIGQLHDAISDSTRVFLACNSEHEKEFLRSILKVQPALKGFIANRGILICNRLTSRLLSTIVIHGKNSHAVLENGLGLIPDSIIETRFETEVDERRIRSALASHPRCVGIGIKKNTSLALRGRKFFTFDQGKAKFMLAANERQPQRNQTIGVDVQRKSRFDYSSNLVDLTEWRRDAIDRTLPPFPPADPRPPVVENGTLVIVGGGGMPRNLMQKIVDMAGGKESARMVYIPCSEQDEVSNAQRTVDMWKKMGVKSADYLHTKDRNQANSDEKFLEPLKNATGLWFGGGRQWNFSDSYYGTRAHKLMKDVLKRNGVIGGSSAGASIQARYLARATPIGNFQIMAPGYERGGLGFISGVAIDQHFTQRGRQKDMTQLMNRHPQLLGIGIDEATAIIVTKSKSKVVGRGRVHFYDRRLPVYPDKPDYVALGAGSEYDLEERRVLIDRQPEPKSEKKAQPETQQSETDDKKNPKRNTP